MFTAIKKISVIALAFTLTFSGLSSAQAAGPTLTFSEFIASQGYKDLKAALANYEFKLQAATGIKLDLSMTTTTMGETSEPITSTVRATKTAAVSTMNIDGETISMSYFDGFYYLGLNDATYELDTKNYKTIGKRLPSSKITKVKFSSAPSPDNSLIDLDPSSLFGPDSASNLLDSLLAETRDKFSFSEVTSKPNLLTPTSTDYFYDMTFVEPQTGSDITMGITDTLDSEGNLTSTVIKQTAIVFGITLVVDITLNSRIDNTIVLTSPSASTVISSAKFVALDNQMSAETALRPNAAKIVTKAKSLAKSAKKSLAGSHLVAAAKALKISTKAVTNGVKLSTKYKGVTGYLCVTAYKGVATTKNC